MKNAENKKEYEAYIDDLNKSQADISKRMKSIAETSPKIHRGYGIRAWHWIHDTIMIVGILSILMIFGGARVFGYYFDFALVPMELTEKIAKR